MVDFVNRGVLPFFRRPISGETFRSYIARNAVIYKLSADGLFEYILSSDFFAEKSRKQDYCIEEDSISVPRLRLIAKALSSDENEIVSHCGLHLNFSSIQDIACHTTHNFEASRKVSLEASKRAGWCPLCLLDDSANGSDQYIRQSWSVSWTTICSIHVRPLIENCSHCGARCYYPQMTFFQDYIRLICPKCEVPHDGQHGLDYTTDRNTLDWMKRTDLKEAWKKLSKFESQCIKSRMQSKSSKNYMQASSILSLLNQMLFVPKFDRFSLMDFIEVPFFSAPHSLNYGRRGINETFHSCTLNERRKVMAILLTLLTSDYTTFGIDRENLIEKFLNNRHKAWDVSKALDCVFKIASNTLLV